MIKDELYNHFAVLRLTEGGKTPIKGELHQKDRYVKTSAAAWSLHSGNYGILAGERSGNLEVLDFDLKNTDNESFMEEYQQLILEQLGKDFLKSIVIQQTQSGGFHFLYRASNLEGNQKLARPKESKEAVIETRGEGGYIVVAPSLNYKFIQGSPATVPTITDEQRNILIESARAMDEYRPPEVKTRVPTGLSDSAKTDYFERYDKETSVTEVLSMLEANGWSEATRRGSKILMKRDGSENPFGADLDAGVADIPLFYVWSTSTEFNTEEAYTPVAIRNLLYDNEDWSETFKYLKSLYDSTSSEVEGILNPLKKRHNTLEPVTQTVDEEEAEQDLFEMLEQHRVTDRTVVEDEPVIIKIKDIPIASAGNVASISGRVKSGKSAIVNAIISKALDPDAIGFDMIEVAPHEGKAIIHLDTEQSKGKQKQNLEYWILNRTRLKHTPDNYYSYNFKQFTVKEARSYLAAILDGAYRRHGGVHLVLIDGLSEFVKTVNDEEGSVTVVKMIMELSSIYKCAFMGIIHTNPAGADGIQKERGHLGSEIQRKAESVLNVNREQGESHSTFKASYLRNGDPVQFGEISIGYSQEKRMHEVVEVKEFADSHAKAYKDQAHFVAGMDRKTAARRISQNHNITINAAKRIITELEAGDYIQETDGMLQSIGHIGEGE